MGLGGLLCAIRVRVKRIRVRVRVRLGMGLGDLLGARALLHQLSTGLSQGLASKLGLGQG